MLYNTERTKIQIKEDFSVFWLFKVWLKKRKILRIVLIMFIYIIFLIFFTPCLLHTKVSPTLLHTPRSSSKFFVSNYDNCIVYLYFQKIEFNWWFRPEYYALGQFWWPCKYFEFLFGTRNRSRHQGWSKMDTFNYCILSWARKLRPFTLG